MQFVDYYLVCVERNTYSHSPMVDSCKRLSKLQTENRFDKIEDALKEYEDAVTVEKLSKILDGKYMESSIRLIGVCARLKGQSKCEEVEILSDFIC